MTNLSKLLFFVLCIGLLVLGCKKEPTIRESFSPANQALGKNIPLLIINTFDKIISDEPKVPASLEVYEEGKVTLKHPIAIEVRGSTSQLFDKKSYGFEFRNENDKDVDVSLLGFPPEEDFILYGPYSDKTFLRNVIAYEISNRLDLYASRTKVVEVQLNDVYKGAYILLEKMKRDDNRIDINELNQNENMGLDITGGYIIKIDKEGAGGTNYTAETSFRSKYDTNGNVLITPPYGPKLPQETYFVYNYPDRDEITPAQKSYIQTYIHSVDSVLLIEDYLSTPRSYEDWLDVSSFVKFWLVNEITGNVDAYRLSTFLHKDRGGRLKFGPVWDFNIAMGNDGRSVVDRWVYRYNLYYPNDLWLNHFWWTTLIGDPLIRSAIKQEWHNARNSVWSDNELSKLIDLYQTTITTEKVDQRNYEKYDVLQEYLLFNSQVAGSYVKEVDYLKKWLLDRASWMDAEISKW